MERFTDQDALIDAIEVSDDFVTVYINSHEQGLPGSVQKQFLEKFIDILPNPNYHDPERFHEPGDPRGDKWRVWKKKFGCHFHILGEPMEILKQLLTRADISPKLRGQLNVTYSNRL